MKKNNMRRKAALTKQELEQMTSEQIEAIVCDRLFTLYKSFPKLKEFQRRQAMNILFELEVLAAGMDVEEYSLWNRIIEHFNVLAAHCRAKEASKV